MHMSGGLVGGPRRKIYDSGTGMPRDAPADPRSPARSLVADTSVPSATSQARWLHPRELVRAQQPHVSAAVLATGTTPLEAGARRERSHPALRLPGGHTSDAGDARRLTGLADLVDEIVACLDQPDGEPLRAAVVRCNTELEAYLEDQRARDQRAAGAQDELRGLARQLRSDWPDATVVVRRIRRVLGRIDARSRGGGGAA